MTIWTDKVIIYIDGMYVCNLCIVRSFSIGYTTYVRSFTFFQSRMLKSKTGDEVARGEEEEQSVRGEEGREQGGDEGRDTGLIEEVAVIVCRMLRNLKVSDF